MNTPPENAHPAATYQNPVLDNDFPDPSVLLAPDGYYYAYATQTRYKGKILNFQVARSKDLVDWEHLGEALPQKPTWAATSQRFWAPDVSRHPDGRYLLYYSAQPNDPLAGLCLGVAVATQPTGPFVDSGQPLLAGGPGFENIDPMRFVEPGTGQQLLFWGSGFGPLRVRALAPDGLSFAPGSTEAVVLAPRSATDYASYGYLIEGSWVHWHAGWYYLFYSGDNCCGPDARYAVLVARARAATGPYETLAEATGTAGTILSENQRWQAPGHNCLVTDAAGQDWLLYHAIDREQPTFDAINNEQGYSRRVLLLDKVQYDEAGWPHVGTPSIGPRPAPVTQAG
ncbi:family 43 glycosylhydrolase [Hymenobacter ginsengisoli]|uniref:Family 43 glycosylhydrolase n=1 Tax=Hymenobacter ginsengisoli TaxID=1051626 RepID=A0ABP8QC11_9BACT|nr:MULTISPECIES: glycoside hydrolase family 43 protein [unclassified Hymenobacter]MBO2032127.1 family 43 glycosylhydrolase [Hymenobacter sp. BT559]